VDRVTEITRDCLNAIAQLRAASAASLPPAQEVHSRLRRFVDDLLRKAGEAGLGREEATDVAYPVVALADEVMQGKDDEAVRTYWNAHPLQLQYFGENVAGEAFFERLERARRDRRRTDALRAHYLALAFGFQGRFRVRGGELELLGLTEAVAREVLRGGESDRETLSPHGEGQGERSARTKRGGLVLWIAAGLLGTSVLLYAILRIALASGTSDVVERISALAKG
jgi:type VI secretion system protein ImpK